MNNVLNVLLFRGLAACLVVAFGLWVFQNVGTGLWFSLMVAAAFGALFVWTCFRRSPVPDFVQRAGSRCFEREGLCFAVVPGFADGRGRIELLYQNRYDTPCDADFLLRPSHEAAASGLKRLRMQVHCDGGAFGRVSAVWPVLGALEGDRVRVIIGATVEYPRGR